jgi:malate dehydrogenase
MSSVAILGAGERGAAVAHALAMRARVRDVLLIDENAGVAAGKALDIRQSGPVDRSDVRVESASDPLAAAGAGVIVFADAVDGGEWRDDKGLALVDRLKRAGSKAALVFAGPNQIKLMSLTAKELGWPGDRLIGTAASALVGTVRSLVGLETGGSGVNVSVTLGGVPPSVVVAWSSATIDGTLVTDRVPAHRLMAIGDSLKKFWPPSPRAVAAPTALIVEALTMGSRRLHQAVTVVDGARGRLAMLPLSLGEGRVLSVVRPSVTPQERTAMERAD